MGAIIPLDRRGPEAFMKVAPGPPPRAPAGFDFTADLLEPALPFPLS